MARPRRTSPTRSTGDYRHDEARRKNNPPVGMVAYEAKTAEQPQAHYGYDPHLSPQLIWAGKPGLVSIEVEDAAGLEVDTVSLHIHERVSTQAIIHAVRASQVAAWFLDSDYDRRTFHICQAFFPNKSAWQKLARALKGTLNDDLFDQLTGRVSLPFQPGEHRRIAVKVIDQRGNEVMRVVGV